MNARIRSINAEQGYSHREILIVGNSNKLVYLTSRITVLSSTKLHYIFRCSLTDKTHALTFHMYTRNFQKVL